MLVTIDTEKAARIIFDEMMKNLKHVDPDGFVARAYVMAAEHVADYIKNIDLWYKEDKHEN